MKRLVLVAALVGMIVLAGCTGGVVNEEALAEDAEYDWDEAEARGSVDVSGSSYTAILQVNGQETIELYRQAELGRESALPIRAIQFRYPNGTVVGAEKIEVEEADSRTVITPPADEGALAYTATTHFGEFLLPVAVNGSHEVVLPEGARMNVPIIGVAEPGGYEKTIEDDRVHLYWEDPDTDTITVSYYLQRDLYLFGGLIALLVLVSGAGLLYLRRQLQGLEAQREAAGLDVEDEE